jgi:mono/diheme cytochrome c family protein
MKTGSLVVLALAAEMLISCHAVADSSDTNHSTDANWAAGRALFLKNCAHCHGADARGDEGPDLHKLDVSDEWIANRIRKGKAGEMTAFAGKLQPSEINLLVLYLHTLK